MARIEIDCKAEFTIWWRVAVVLKWAGIKHPKWMLSKTIAWVKAGNYVRQIKLAEAV